MKATWWRYSAIALYCVLLQGLCLAETTVDLQDLLGSAVDTGAGDLGFVTAAPVVVVATVTSNEPVGLPIEARRVPGVFLQLRRIGCHLENVLRGPGPGDSFASYYFADAKLAGGIPNPIHRLLFDARRGRRYILFLSRERGVLRSIGDVGSYTVPVLSGAHPSYVPTPDDPFSTGLRRAIADILLTPGQGFEPSEFSQDIAYARLIADQLGSRPYTVQLLSNLLTQMGPIRVAACFELAHSYYGHYGCLAELKEDSTLAPEIRRHAAEVLEEQIRSDGVLKRTLLDPATLDFGKMLRPDSRRANMEELQLILADPDPEVRKLACTALKRYFPYEQASECK
jgi:hypothetical protein